MRWLSRCETQDRQVGSPAKVRQGQTQPALIAICKDTKRNNKIVRLSGAWVNTAPNLQKKKWVKNLHFNIFHKGSEQLNTFTVDNDIAVATVIRGIGGGGVDICL